MFVVAMILAMCAYLVSIALGIGIKTHAPSLSHVVGDAWVALWPFWVFSFLSPTKRRALSPLLRSVAVVADTRTFGGDDVVCRVSIRSIGRQLVGAPIWARPARSANPVAP